ncbi:MAG TPA: transposase [Pyrinomonadaceae bacterium]|jgi:transposase/predicted nucleic acid-binding Zn finger protein
MSLREAKGRQIADRVKIVKEGNLYLVPSQSGRGRYRVRPDLPYCSCPDFDFRRQPCKHIYAVQITVEKTETTKTSVVENGKTTVTETTKVERKTYRQEWPAYNKAQTNEKRLFLYLLNQLCQGVGEPAQLNGRPRLPLEDIIFAMAYKVYSTVSGRRFQSDLKDAHAKGYLSQVPSYNSMFDYFNSEMLTSYLQMLIEESSLPLASIENDFAVDSSGLSTCRFVQWNRAKYFDNELIERKEWIKVHLMCGVKTNVVTSVEITDRYAGDAPQFPALVERTAQGFLMNEVSADKAYLSTTNLKAVTDNNAMPYIPFKSNSTGKSRTNKQSALWKQMYHYFSYNQERFMKQYHKRSNVETTFHMIKSKFGDALRSKTRRAQINEALCKVLCHNICCLIQAMYELGLKPKFYAEAA